MFIKVSGPYMVTLVIHIPIFNKWYTAMLVVSLQKMGPHYRNYGVIPLVCFYYRLLSL